MTGLNAAMLNVNTPVIRGAILGVVLTITSSHCFIKWDDGTYTERRLIDMNDIEKVANDKSRKRTSNKNTS